jgi:glucosyl-dolichyl phosphate glucuronosyltransferase
LNPTLNGTNPVGTGRPQPERPAGAPAGSGPCLLTVAICTRNRAGFLREAVESVLAQATADTQVLVVDNASTDDTETVARGFSRHPGVSVLREPELGLSAARNTALRQARGEFVIFLDDDAVAEPGWLAAYRELIEHPPSADLAACGGAVFPHYATPTPWWLHPQAYTLNWSERAQPFREQGNPWGCNFAVRRDRARSLGGFNPRLGRKGGGMGAHEESELLDKLRLAGGRVWWLPQARIRHHVAADRLTFGANCRGEFCQGRSTAIYRFRRQPGRGRAGPGRWLRLGAAPFHCLVCLAAAAGMMLTGRPMLAVQHLFRAARNAGLGWQLALDAFRRFPSPDDNRLCA